MSKYFFIVCFLLKMSTLCVGQKGKVYHADDFTSPLDTTKWFVEVENIPPHSIKTENNCLILNTKGGTTVWFRKKLKGNYKISYLRTVLVEKGENDRLSDLNQFWLANDPNNKNLFTRSGKLADYDSLSLYYVGMGGNYNSTTRFRKYQSGDRKLLAEKNDSLHLLKPNHEYKIEIIVQDGTTSFWVDGECYFSHTTPENQKSDGYFGFRSTYSRQRIRKFRVYRL